MIKFVGPTIVRVPTASLPFAVCFRKSADRFSAFRCVSPQELVARLLCHSLPTVNMAVRSQALGGPPSCNLCEHTGDFFYGLYNIDVQVSHGLQLQSQLAG